MDKNNKEKKLKKEKFKKYAYFAATVVIIGGVVACLAVPGLFGFSFPGAGVAIITFAEFKKARMNAIDLARGMDEQPEQENKKCLDDAEPSENFNGILPGLALLFALNDILNAAAFDLEETGFNEDLSMSNHSSGEALDLQIRAHNLLLIYKQMPDVNFTTKELREFNEVISAALDGNVPEQLISYYNLRLSEFETILFSHQIDRDFKRKRINDNHER